MPKAIPSPAEAAASSLQAVERAVKSAVDAFKTAVRDPSTEPFTLAGIARLACERLTRSVTAGCEELADLNLRLASAADEGLDTYAERLNKALEEASLPLQGTVPNLIVDGRVFVAFDRREGILRLNGETVADPRLHIVVATIRNRLELMRRVATPPKEFAIALSAAYDEEIALSRKAAGDQVRIDSVHRHLVWSRQSKSFNSSYRAAAYREYTSEMFRSDLYSLLVSGEPAPDGRTFDVDSGAETAGALLMFVPSLGRTAYVGRLRLTNTGA